MRKLLNIIILIAVLSSCGKLSQCEYFYGIDVSHHNGDVDWNLVSSDSRIGFAYIKATEGKTYVDPTFHKNLTEAKRNNILAINLAILVVALSEIVSRVICLREGSVEKS